MYWIIDEICVPKKYRADFIKRIPYFKKLYLDIKGITSVTYCTTKLKDIGNIIYKNPEDSFLLIITFDKQSSFKTYHDNSTLARETHTKISKYFGGKQLQINTSIHGDDDFQAFKIS